MLIGAKRFWELVCIGQIRLGKNKSVLHRSLGWLISGPISLPSSSNKGLLTSCNLSTIEELTRSVHKFWEVEDYVGTKSTNNRRRLLRKII